MLSFPKEAFQSPPTACIKPQKQTLPPEETVELNDLERRSKRFIDAGLKSMEELVSKTKPGRQVFEAHVGMISRKLCWDMLATSCNREGPTSNIAYCPMPTLSALMGFTSTAKGNILQELKARTGALRLGGIGAAASNVKSLMKTLADGDNGFHSAFDVLEVDTSGIALARQETTRTKAAAMADALFDSSNLNTVEHNASSSVDRHATETAALTDAIRTFLKDGRHICAADTATEATRVQRLAEELLEKALLMQSKSKSVPKLARVQSLTSQTFSQVFPQELTAPGSFHVPSSTNLLGTVTPATTTKVYYMHARGSFQYSEKEGLCKAVCLPLTGGLELVVVSPSEGLDAKKKNSRVGALEVLQRLSGGAWEAIASGFQLREGDVLVPKFALTPDVSLRQTLASQGCESLCYQHDKTYGQEEPLLDLVQNTNFSISETGFCKPLYAPPEESQVIGKLGGSILGMAMPGQNRRFRVHCDHPFLVFIRHPVSNSILNAAVVGNPTAAEDVDKEENLVRAKVSQAQDNNNRMNDLFTEGDSPVVQPAQISRKRSEPTLDDMFSCDFVPSSEQPVETEAANPPSAIHEVFAAVQPDASINEEATPERTHVADFLSSVVSSKKTVAKRRQRDSQPSLPEAPQNTSFAFVNNTVVPPPAIAETVAVVPPSPPLARMLSKSQLKEGERIDEDEEMEEEAVRIHDDEEECSPPQTSPAAAEPPAVVDFGLLCKAATPPTVDITPKPQKTVARRKGQKAKKDPTERETTLVDSFAFALPSESATTAPTTTPPAAVDHDDIFGGFPETVKSSVETPPTSFAFANGAAGGMTSFSALGVGGGGGSVPDTKGSCLDDLFAAPSVVEEGKESKEAVPIGATPAPVFTSKCVSANPSINRVMNIFEEVPEKRSNILKQQEDVQKQIALLEAQLQTTASRQQRTPW